MHYFQEVKASPKKLVVLLLHNSKPSLRNGVTHSGLNLLHQLTIKTIPHKQTHRPNWSYSSLRLLSYVILDCVKGQLNLTSTQSAIEENIGISASSFFLFCFLVLSHEPAVFASGHPAMEVKEQCAQRTMIFETDV